MSSDEYDESKASTSMMAAKKTRHGKGKITVEQSQRCIAAALAKVVHRMVNKDMQQHCKELLEMKDLAETEARLLYVLQQIDQEREEEEEKAQKDKKEAGQAKSRKRK